jgi:ATP-dependent helicase HrpA
MKIPVGLISKAAAENVERYLPSLLQEKTLHLLKSLPKGLRLKLPAASQIAGQFANQMSDSRKPLPSALSQFIQDKYQITIPREAWNLEKLPAHLNILYSVIDERGAEVKVSRDLDQLRDELSGSVNISALDKIRPQWEKDDIASWDFGTLPEKIPLAGQHGLIGYAYPALQAADNAINLRLFSDQRESEVNHIHGVAALYGIHFADKLKQLKKNITLPGLSKLWAVKIGNPKLLEQSLLQRVKTDLLGRPWRSQDEFFHHANMVDAQILPSGQHLLAAIDPVLEAFSDTHSLLQRLLQKNTGNKPVLTFLKNTQDELQLLVPIDFPTLYSFERMKELPRYMKALSLRAERGSLNLAAARKKIEDIAVYSQRLWQIIASTKEAVIPTYTLQSTSEALTQLPLLSFRSEVRNLNISDEKQKKIEELFWMIEEYKVSLFAQELKTPYPVSPRKLDQLISEIQNKN